MVTLLEAGGRYASPDRKMLLISSSADVEALPTSTKPGSGLTGLCAKGSIAYTADLSFVAMLGNDDVWHEI